MKIALASAPTADKDIQKNLTYIAQAAEQCRGDADLIVFGEAVLQGFNCLTWEYEKDRKTAVSQTDAPIAQIRRIAKENHMAISFGYIEKSGDLLYSSQLVIDSFGTILFNYRRVSAGWKFSWLTDSRYREGEHFGSFSYMGRKFSIGLCGDLWTEGKPEEMRGENADIVLWPVNCNFEPEEWNRTVKYEYAVQAALCGDKVLYVNPFCVNPDAEDCSTGGAAYFKKGVIASELPAGGSGILLVEI